MKRFLDTYEETDMIRSYRHLKKDSIRPRLQWENRYRCFTIKSGLLLILSFILFIGPLSAEETTHYFQRIEIPSSFNPVGSGARALGMGGAFIGVADDATAASWNPGGLIQLERPEISIVGDRVHRIETIHIGADAPFSGEQSVDDLSLNYFSLSHPFQLASRNMIVSINYQRLYDLTRQWSFPLHIFGNQFDVDQNVEYRQDGALSALGFAYCLQMTPTFSIGLTLNVWHNDISENEWQSEVYQRGNGVESGDRFELYNKTTDSYTFSGINMNIGVMVNATANLTLGGVIKTPFSADIDHDHSVYTLIDYPDLIGFGSTSTSAYSESANLEMPLSYGIGAAYRFNDRLTLSMDIYRTEWNDFIFEDGKGNRTSPLTGKESKVKATHQVRMGGEYLVLNPAVIIPLRWGVFYDPAPGEGSPDDVFGFSIGSGIVYGRYILDIAYQYRWGDGIGEHILPELNFSQDVSEHQLYASMILHF